SKGLNPGEDDPWMLFFEGSAHLYSSFMNTKNGSMWSAYRNARSGVKALEKVIELDSTFYDAYLGVGSFKYWKSSKAKSLTWLPFISDERDLGISMVRQAIHHGRFVPLVGADQLAWILLDSGDHEGALKLAVDNHELYPTSRFFKWTLVSIYRKSGKPDETEALFSSLLKEIRMGAEKNHYNEIICLLRLAEIAAGRSDFDRARILLDELFALDLDKAMKKRANHNIEDARELRKTLIEQRTENSEQGRDDLRVVPERDKAVRQ
ncbi:MAG: tetratricopeptide repeat protein, partial [Calditrichota bacterium]